MSRTVRTAMEKLLLTTKQPERTICWKRVTKNEQVEVNDLLIEHFATREPLGTFRGLSRQENVDLIVGIANECIDNTASVCAYDLKSKMICGAALASGPYNQGTQPKYGKVSNFLKVNQISRLLERAGRKIPEYANQRPYSVMELGVVNAKYARQNIVTALFNKSLSIAKTNNIPLFYAECTSYGSARMLKKMGWQCVEEVVLADYVDPHTGSKTFANIPKPDTSIKLMVATLGQHGWV